MDGIDVDLDLSRLSLWSKEAKIFAVKMQVGHEELKSIRQDDRTEAQGKDFCRLCSIS